MFTLLLKMFFFSSFIACRIDIPEIPGPDSTLLPTYSSYSAASTSSTRRGNDTTKLIAFSPTPAPAVNNITDTLLLKRGKLDKKKRRSEILISVLFSELDIDAPDYSDSLSWMARDFSTFRASKTSTPTTAATVTGCHEHCPEQLPVPRYSPRTIETNTRGGTADGGKPVRPRVCATRASKRLQERKEQLRELRERGETES